MNRVFPYLPDTVDSLDDEMVDLLFKFVHLSPVASLRISSFSFLFKIARSGKSEKFDNLINRCFVALNHQLLFPNILEASNVAILFNLIINLMEDHPAQGLPILRRLIQLTITSGDNPGHAAMALKIFLNYLTTENVTDVSSLLLNSDAELQNRKEIIMQQKRKKSKKAVKVENEDPRGYDPLKRDPLYARADESAMWEFHIFANHIHPTISLDAQSILTCKDSSSKKIAAKNTHISRYRENILLDFSLPRFLTELTLMSSNLRLEENESFKKFSKKSSLEKSRNMKKASLIGRNLAIEGESTEKKHMRLPHQLFSRQYLEDFHVQSRKRAKSDSRAEEDVSEEYPGIKRSKENVEDEDEREFLEEQLGDFTGGGDFVDSEVFRNERGDIDDNFDDLADDDLADDDSDSDGLNLDGDLSD
eukprot:GHVL01016248.1.p1 GENE.GHVL01016248.1~~GHVL01016248.1.p1  ORF type:complete len:420 (+),score=95.84 GHVL01016248.1:1152-2411(+)